MNPESTDAGVVVGLECCLADPPTVLRDPNRKFGLLLNQASVDAQWRYASDLLAQRFPGQLVSLFSPQHGLWGQQQANMIESPHGHYTPLDVPIYSLYSETRRPTKEMLGGIDLLVVDLQDVGTRVYTFIWTIVHCLAACAEMSIPVVILDRPNPLGGNTFEGPLLQPGFESFVGMASIPMRHGLTLGELARLLNHELKIHAELEVVAMKGWRREILFSRTGRSWTLPSPNMPRYETTLVYPGQVLLEGTNLSEGRGTTIPFEVVGAPFVDPYRLIAELQNLPHPGVTFRPIYFVPTFDKWMGNSCGGIAWHLENEQAARSVMTTLSVLSAVKNLWPESFRWLPPPYEYEREKMPIDILYGSSRLRETLDRGGLNAGQVEDLAVVDDSEWRARIKPHVLYE